jgi:hypothetical protein
LDVRLARELSKRGKMLEPEDGGGSILKAKNVVCMLQVKEKARLERAFKIHRTIKRD